MSFNVRFDTPADASAGNRWSDRLGSVVETVRRDRPDVIGFQEALRRQLDDLIAALPSHLSVGKPRETGDVGEFVPIFFSRRFEAEASGDFWLSPTPEAEGSQGWDASVPRHCTWVRLLDRRSGLRFAAFNTHLDVWGEVARREAVRVILARLALVPGLASVVMGDMNALEDSEPLEAFRRAGLVDTFRLVHPDARDVQTVHHYVDLAGTGRIDFILCDRRWEVLDAAIVREPAAGRLPSDHYPVTAELRPKRSG